MNSVSYLTKCAWIEFYEHSWFLPRIQSQIHYKRARSYVRAYNIGALSASRELAVEIRADDATRDFQGF